MLNRLRVRTNASRYSADLGSHVTVRLKSLCWAYTKVAQGRILWIMWMITAPYLSSLPMECSFIMVDGEDNVLDRPQAEAGTGNPGLRWPSKDPRRRRSQIGRIARIELHLWNAIWSEHLSMALGFSSSLVLAHKYPGAFSPLHI